VAARLVFFWASPAGPEVELRALDALRRVPADVLLHGDSVIDYVAAGDTDRDSLARKLRASLPGCVTRNLAQSAYHAEIFAPLTRFMLKDPATQARLVIVPINLRSFTNGWIKHPAYRFEELKQMLSRDSTLYNLAHRPLSVFQWYKGAEGSWEDFDRSPAYDGNRVIGTLADLSRRAAVADPDPAAQRARLQASFVLRYAQRITPEDQRLRAVIELARTLRDRGVRGLFYLTPVDVVTIERYAGPAVRTHLAANARLIAAALAHEGFAVRDWSFALGPSGFSYSVNPNEHLSESGRRDIAARLAEAAREELQNLAACGPRAATRPAAVSPP
jgi:hypothetical protein